MDVANWFMAWLDWFLPPPGERMSRLAEEAPWLWAEPVTVKNPDSSGKS